MDFVALTAVVCLFGWIPITAVYKNKIRLEELRLQQKQGGDAATLHAVEELRREVQTLRETATKFDLSFDAGLSRLEDRMDRVEAEQRGQQVRPSAEQAAQSPAAAPRPTAWYTPSDERVVRNGHG